MNIVCNNTNLLFVRHSVHVDSSFKEPLANDKPPCILCYLSTTTRKCEQPKKPYMEATWFYKIRNRLLNFDFCQHQQSKKNQIQLKQMNHTRLKYYK